MKIKWAKRIEELPPYLFAEIDRRKNELIEKGVDVIDLGVGDPDIPTPDHIIESLREAAGDPANHRYPSYVGMPVFQGGRGRVVLGALRSKPRPGKGSSRADRLEGRDSPRAPRVS